MRNTWDFSVVLILDPIRLPLDSLGGTLLAYPWSPWDSESESKINTRTFLGQFVLVSIVSKQWLQERKGEDGLHRTVKFQLNAILLSSYWKKKHPIHPEIFSHNALFVFSSTSWWSQRSGNWLRDREDWSFNSNAFISRFCALIADFRLVQFQIELSFFLVEEIHKFN